MKVLWIASLAAFSLFMASLLTVGWIETAALSQPSIPDSLYRHPHEIKGAIRFFTNQQETIYSIAKPTMVVALILVAMLVWLAQRRSEGVP